MLFSGIFSKVTCFQSTGCLLISRHSWQTRARPHSSIGFKCWNIRSKQALLRRSLMRLNWLDSSPAKNKGGLSNYHFSSSWQKGQCAVYFCSLPPIWFSVRRSRLDRWNLITIVYFKIGFIDRLFEFSDRFQKSGLFYRDKVLPLYLGVDVFMEDGHLPPSKDSLINPPVSSVSLFSGVTVRKLSEALLAVPTEFFRLLLLINESFLWKSPFLACLRLSTSTCEPVWIQEVYADIYHPWM